MRVMAHLDADAKREWECKNDDQARDNNQAYLTAAIAFICKVPEFIKHTIHLPTMSDSMQGSYANMIHREKHY